MKKVIFAAIGFSGQGGSETVYNTVLEHYSTDENLGIKLVSFDSVPSNWCAANVTKENFVLRTQAQTPQNKIKLMIGLFRYFSRVNADIVISSSPGTLKILNFARKFNHHKFKIVSWVHFDLTADKAQTVAEIADQFVSLSDSNTNHLQALSYPAERILTVYNPIKKQDKTITGNGKTVRLIYIGRLQFGQETQKNLRELFDALSNLTSTNWHLDLYGDGDERENCEHYVEQIEIAENVTFHGWTTHPFDKISDATALVMTSNYEGLPMAMIEAMSYGIPVISSEINGPKELITAENGLLYPLHQTEKLTALLEKVIKLEVKFDAEAVKSSVSKYYEENYFVKFDKVFEE